MSSSQPKGVHPPIPIGTTICSPTLIEVTVEVGTEHFTVHVTVAEPTERDRLFADVVRQAPNFGEYQKETSRILPVVLLKRVNER